MEGAATTVYATGGRGNPNLIAWEGERTLTFTMEDALLSPEGLSILTGAGLIAAKDANNGRGMFVHTTDTIDVQKDNTIVLKNDFACWTKIADGNVRDGEDISEYQNPAADIFVMVMDDSGNIVSEPCIPAKVEYALVTDPVTGKTHPQTTLTCYGHDGVIPKDTIVFVDYYVRRIAKATQVEITADKFGGSYYIEADTLFRREGDNYDMPATFVIPNGKVQSNFTFAMAATGDPSTFTFTIDAMPDYTKFDRTHKILAGILIIEDEDEDDVGEREVCFPTVVGEVPEGATVSYTKNTENETDMTISGTVKAMSKTDLAAVGFGGLDSEEDLKVTVMTIELPVEGNTNYMLKTTSPMHEYYKGDSNIDSSGIKTQRKLTSANDTTWTITTGLCNDDGDSTFELYKTASAISTTGTLVKKITIKNELEFA